MKYAIFVLLFASDSFTFAIHYPPIAPQETALIFPDIDDNGQALHLLNK